MQRDYLIALYDLYKNLLTDKQRSYFEEYYYFDLSFAEIAINFNVSRNAVFDQIKKTKDILSDYENKLHLNKMYNNLAECLEISDINKIKQKIKDIIEE